MNAPVSVKPAGLDGPAFVSLAAAIGAVAVVGVGLSLSIPLLAFELETRGVSSTLIGFNTAAAGLANLLTAPLVPALVRRFGVRPMLLAASLAGAATLVAFKVAEPLWLWFVLRFAAGAALCVVFVCSEFWINAAAPAHRRGLVIGIYATTLSLGFAAGPALLALTGTSGWRPYLVGAGLMILATVPVALAGALAPRIARGGPTGVLRFVLLAPAATFAALVFGAVETGELSFLPLYAVRLGLPEGVAALVLTAAMLGNVLCQIPLGWLSDRADRRLVLAGCGAVGAIGAVGLLVVPVTSALFFAIAFVTGGIVAGLYTVGLAHLGARFSGGELAGANAAFVMCYSAGFMLGPPLLGAAMDAWNPYGLPAALAVLLATYTAGVIIRRPRPARN